MSQIISIGRYSFQILIILMAFAGCSTPNDKAPIDSDTGQHASDWVYAGHAAVSIEDTTTCMECHGSDLAGGMSDVSCSQCHLNGSPLTLTGCTSCHGNPPTGNAAPNRRGAHSTHNALPVVANVCNSCHNGAGSNTPKHYNGVIDTMILSTYNSTSGTAARNADGTCSNVSCHGGQTTPAWLTGTLDVNTQCTSCHAYASPEYNSFFSGKHDKHVNTEGVECWRCHDTTKLAISHFTSLNTSTMEGPTSATLLSSLSYTGGSCTPACHATKSW